MRDRGRSDAYAEGDRIVITAAGHPHQGEHGVIVASATGGPASVGLDWEIKLERCPEHVSGCFVSEGEIHRG